MSIQSLVLIAVDRFGAVVFPLRSPLISSKLCPFFILATPSLGSARWLSSPHISSPSNLLNIQESHSGVWFALERNLWRILILWPLLRANFDDILCNPVGVDSHTLHYHLYKAQVTEDSRRAIGQRWTTTPTKGTKCVKDGHCCCVRVCSMVAVPLYRLVSPLLCSGHVVLWLRRLWIFCHVHGSHKLCHESLYVSFSVEIIA